MATKKKAPAAKKPRATKKTTTKKTKASNGSNPDLVDDDGFAVVKGTSFGSTVQSPPSGMSPKHYFENCS